MTNRPNFLIMEQLSYLSEINITYNPKITPTDRPKVTSPEDAYHYFLELLGKTNLNIKEEAAVLFLNRGNRVIGAYKLSTGGITSTVVDIRIILGIALKCLACGIMLAHTHPSGELQPSKYDLALTVKLKEACKLIDIQLLDHLIITKEKYHSFADNGMI